MYKNINKQEVLSLKEQVAYQQGQVVSKTLVQNELVSVTIFSFDQGEEISTHASGGDAMVTVLDGKGRFTIGGQVYHLEQGRRSSCQRIFPTPYMARKNSKCCWLSLFKEALAFAK